MNKREKIIVALMCAALLYGGYALFFGSSDDTPMPNSSTASEHSAAIQELVKKVHDTLAEETVTETEKYIIAKAEAGWKQDPFLEIIPEKRAAAKAAGPGAGEPEKKVNIRYTGYIEMGDLRMAILNGQEYEPGEEILPGGYILREVTPDQVIVEAKADKSKITIKIVEEKL